jgi:hypothetical protein
MRRKKNCGHIILNLFTNWITGSTMLAQCLYMIRGSSTVLIGTHCPKVRMIRMSIPSIPIDIYRGVEYFSVGNDGKHVTVGRWV